SQGRPGLRAQGGPAAPVPPECEGTKTGARLGQEVRGVLDASARPHQGSRREESVRRIATKRAQERTHMRTATRSREAFETFEIRKEIEIAAPIEIAWEAALDELGPEGVMPDGRSLQLKFEAWPGGRWYRDLGNNSGHLWGHVQVIKPPTLLEICGPLMMSYPAVNFVQYRLK